MRLGLASGFVVFLETLFCGPVNISTCQLGGGGAWDVASRSTSVCMGCSSSR